MKALDWLSNYELTLLNPAELRTLPSPSPLKRSDYMVYRVFQRWEEVFAFPPRVTEVAALLNKRYDKTHGAVLRLIDEGLLERRGRGLRSVRVRGRAKLEFCSDVASFRQSR